MKVECGMESMRERAAPETIVVTAEIRRLLQEPRVKG
jgi:hypothetical protein